MGNSSCFKAPSPAPYNFNYSQKISQFPKNHSIPTSFFPSTNIAVKIGQGQSAKNLSQPITSNVAMTEFQKLRQSENMMQKYENNSKVDLDLSSDGNSEHEKRQENGKQDEIRKRVRKMNEIENEGGKSMNKIGCGNEGENEKKVLYFWELRVSSP